MTNLQEKIREEVKEALRNKETTRLSVLRGLLSAFTNELIASGKKPTEEITDEEALAVIKRALKQREDSIEQFEKGGRPDLADKEKEEILILEPYLPEVASKEEILTTTEQKMTELGIHPDNGSQKGVLIGAVMKEFKGNADGKDVKEVVDEIFGAK